jgi:hypothetical protein
MKIRSKDSRIRQSDEVELEKLPATVDPVYKSKEQYQERLTDGLRLPAQLAGAHGPAERDIGATIAPDALERQPAVRLASVSADHGERFLNIMDWVANKLREAPAAVD